MAHFKSFKTKNRGRTSLRSAVGTSNYNTDQQNNKISKPSSSVKDSKLSGPKGISKSSNVKKRPKKFASAKVASGSGSYNSLLQMLGKSKSSSHQIEEDDDDEEFDEEFDEEEYSDMELAEYDEQKLEQEENEDQDDEDQEDFQSDSDDEDHRSKIEGFNKSIFQDPENNEDEFEDEQENDEDNDKNDEDLEENDTFVSRFINVDSSNYESFAPPSSITTNQDDIIQWVSKPYTTIPQTIFPHKSLIYTPKSLEEGETTTNSNKPKTSTQDKLPTTNKELFKDYEIRPKLQDTWLSESPTLTELQSALIPAIFRYNDLLFPMLNVENHSELKDLFILHILNHILKSNRTIYNDDLQIRMANIREKTKKYKKKTKKEDENSEEEEEEEDDVEQEEEEDEELPEFKDQGFTRPKVLIVLPTKNACYQVLSRLAVLSNAEEVNNKKRFKDAFYSPHTPPANKPDDFIELFSGDQDDLFCLGVKLTIKSLKFYANFYDADIIVASPLGLDMIVNRSETDKNVKNPPEYDFLSSIEIVIVDQADAMFMQKWQHVKNIFDKLNLTPKQSHGCDFSRLKPWFLEEKGKYFRQSIIFSQYNNPDINSLFSNSCLNLFGKVKVRPVYTEKQSCSMAQIVKRTNQLLTEEPELQQLLPATSTSLRIRQTFSRIVPSREQRAQYDQDPSIEPDVRFNYFTTVVLPSLLRGTSQKGTFIYISSYMDYVRVKNYLTAYQQRPNGSSLTFSAIDEYSPVSEFTRAREFFKSGRSKILLYTERFHHYRRFKIKGCQSIIFYSLPENPVFYTEVVFNNLIHLGILSNENKNEDGTSSNLSPEMATVRALYSQWDALKLERIVGSKRVGTMIMGKSETYEFK